MHLLKNRYVRKLRDKWERLSPPQILVFVALLIVLVGSWIFIELADEIFEGGTQAFDDWVLQSLRVPGNPHELIGPVWVHHFFLDVTALGGGAVAVMVALLVIGGLALQRKHLAIVILIVSLTGGAILTTVMKDFFGRPRPPIEYRAVEAAQLSFPSGHSFISAVLYLTLGAMVARVTQRKRMKVYIIFCAVTLTFLVGFSRIYLGVHYPTDVLGGWCAGVIWATACLLTAELLRSRYHARRSDLTEVEE